MLALCGSLTSSGSLRWRLLLALSCNVHRVAQILFALGEQLARLPWRLGDGSTSSDSRLAALAAAGIASSALVLMEAPLPVKVFHANVCLCLGLLQVFLYLFLCLRLRRLQ